MTKHISDLDPYTVRHLDEWLERHFREDHRAVLHATMLQLVAEDEDYWSQQGWWRVYDAAVQDARST